MANDFDINFQYPGCNVRNKNIINWRVTHLLQKS